MLERTSSAGRVASMCAPAAALIGIVVLISYAVHSTALSRLAGGPAIIPNSAAGLVLAGIALLAHRRAARWRGVSIIAASTVTLLGIATLLEYVSGRSFGIDNVLRGFAAWAMQHVGANRPSPQTSMAFVCLGAAIIALDGQGFVRRAPPMRWRSSHWPSRIDSMKVWSSCSRSWKARRIASSSRTAVGDIVR
jgi:hypothetical protein